MLVMRFMLKGDTQTRSAKAGRVEPFAILSVNIDCRACATSGYSPRIANDWSTADDLKLRERYGANVIGVERWRVFVALS